MATEQQGQRPMVMSPSAPATSATGVSDGLVSPEILGRAVFSAGGGTYRWREVIDAAVQRGDWALHEKETLAGLACARRHAMSGEPLDRAALDEAARQFRQSRGLLAGDEMQAWLAHWGLSVPDLREHLVRGHLRQRWADGLDETVVGYPVAANQVAESLWPEAVCSGLLERSAKALAADVALAIEHGVGDSTSGGIAHVLAVADRARLAHQADDAIEREIALNRLEWHRVAGESLELPTLDAAREAAMLIREDKLPLAEVAMRSGGELKGFRFFLSEVSDEEAIAFLGAQEGDLLGARARNGHFAIDAVSRKEPPSAADPEVREKAVSRLAARAIERATSAHVEWHEHL